MKQNNMSSISFTKKSINLKIGPLFFDYSIRLIVFYVVFLLFKGFN